MKKENLGNLYQCTGSSWLLTAILILLETMLDNAFHKPIKHLFKLALLFLFIPTTCLGVLLWSPISAGLPSYDFPNYSWSIYTSLFLF